MLQGIFEGEWASSPDKSLVIVVQNCIDGQKEITFKANGKYVKAILPADLFSTILL